MPLQDTDVTLVSRGSTNANASMTQVKDYVLDGLTSSDALVWSSYPTTANNHISSANTKFDEITAIQFKNKSISIYADNDVIVLTNLATSSAGTYKVTGRNTSTGSVSVSFIAYSNINDNSVGDRMVVTNLGPDVDTDQGNVVIINETSPTGSNGDLWYQPSTNNFHIYNNGWVLLNKKYDNGIYYKNAVEDWEMDNTGTTDVSGKVQKALEGLFNSGNRSGTLYFPAGIYRLDKYVQLREAGNPDRSGFVIKGDGMSTKFYCYKERIDGELTGNVGGIDIRFGFKDNYTTIQDLAIHPKDQIDGVGLYLQNGDDAYDPEDIDTDDGTGDDPGDPDNNEIPNVPSGGSNQQYGVQLINVNILADENKPKSVAEKRNAFFFNFPLSLINFGRPRLERVILWNHAERSNESFVNNGQNNIIDGTPTPVKYSDSYGFAPEDTGIVCNISNCYSPWISNCYFNGTAAYGLFWNSTRGNTEGGKVSQCVINGPDIGIWVAQTRQDEDDDGNPIFNEDGSPKLVEGRHPHFTVIDSHVNSARRGVVLNNVKYFDISHILFYARNDRDRGQDLIDVQLIDCHSGTLSNSYSGGSVGNAAKTAPPGYAITELETDSTAEKRMARSDQKAKAPYRRHVVIEGRNLYNSKGELVRNRQIDVRDVQLNAYIPKVSENNRTLFQTRTRGGGPRLETDDVEWYAPYQVIGDCADVHFSLPPAAYIDNPRGTFDSSQYPPENTMISSNVGPVSFTYGGDKIGLINDGSGGDRLQRMRLELRGGSVNEGDYITSDTYKANTNGKEIATYVQISTKSDEVSKDRQSGSYQVSTARNGTIKTAMELKGNTAYFPVHDEAEMRGKEEPVISLNVPGGADNKPGIYYTESNNNPQNLFPNANAGSILITNQDKMYFKKTGSGANGGWREVNLL